MALYSDRLPIRNKFYRGYAHLKSLCSAGRVTAWPLRQQSYAHRTQLGAYAWAFAKNCMIGRDLIYG
jgi:hypothetical protein